nr:MAG TPA: hypothetical protein [Caudoviricetes sp.]DAV29778.1 MAG TPA: hypothetical protein [Caudoviricetes sp.]
MTHFASTNRLINNMDNLSFFILLSRLRPSI